MNPSKDFDAVIFDMDGVIFDSEIKVIECWQVVADKYGIPDIESMCRECLGINRQVTRDKFLSRYGKDFPYDTCKQEMSDLFHRRYGGGNLPLKPGATELLAFLKDTGKKIALATSTRSSIAIQQLRDAHILVYFDQTVCGDMVTRSKPAPDIFLESCRLLNVLPERSYGIEDSYNGIRAANAAGLRTIMVPDLMEPTEEIRCLTEAVLPSLSAVQNYLMNPQR